MKTAICLLALILTSSCGMLQLSDDSKYFQSFVNLDPNLPVPVQPCADSALKGYWDNGSEMKINSDCSVELPDCGLTGSLSLITATQFDLLVDTGSGCPWAVGSYTCTYALSHHDLTIDCGTPEAFTR